MIPGMNIVSRFSNRLDKSYLGQSLKRGMGESFGVYYHKGKSLGFLGLGRRGAIAGAGSTASRMAWGGFGLASTLFFMYQGYKEEGILGAAKGGATAVATTTAITTALKLARNPMVLGAALVAAGGYGYYKFGKAAIKHGKRMRGLDFGAATADVMGDTSVLTERSRAMSALASTHINGRIALGQEAVLTHTSYR